MNPYATTLSITTTQSDSNPYTSSLSVYTQPDWNPYATTLSVTQDGLQDDFEMMINDIQNVTLPSNLAESKEVKQVCTQHEAQGEDLILLNVVNKDAISNPMFAGSEIQIEYAWQDDRPEHVFGLATHKLEDKPCDLNEPSIIRMDSLYTFRELPTHKRNGECNLSIPLVSGLYEIVVCRHLKFQSTDKLDLEKCQIIARSDSIIHSAGLTVEWKIRHEGSDLVVIAENSNNVPKFNTQLNMFLTTPQQLCNSNPYMFPIPQTTNTQSKKSIRISKDKLKTLLNSQGEGEQDVIAVITEIWLYYGTIFAKSERIVL